MKRTRHKRLLSALMAIVMVVALQPLTDMPISVSAAPTEVNVFVNTLEELQAAMATASTDPEVTTVITVISQPVTMEIESGQHVALDGNGKRIVIEKGRGGYLFEVMPHGTLTLKNITLDGAYEPDAPYYTGSQGGLVRVGGTLNLQDGAVLQNNYAGFYYPLTGEGAFSGGGVFVSIQGTLNMDDGAVIKNCRVSPGGETFGNRLSSAGSGGGVYVSGTFNMYGGEITGNRAAFGGGVFVSTNYDGVLGVFNMYGGEITDNRAARGYDDAAFGGGVLVHGSLTLGGSAKIYGNSADIALNDYKDDNVYVSYNANYDPYYISLGSSPYQPTSGMDVGVQTKEPNGLFVKSGASEAIAGYFTADKSDENVYHVGGQLFLSDALPANSAPVFTDNPADASVTAGQSVTLTANATGLPYPTYHWEYSTYLGEGIYGPWTKILSLNPSNSYTFTATQNMDKRIFRCIATNSEGTVNSNTAILTVLPEGAPVFTSQPQTAYTVSGGSADFFAKATASDGEISYQWQGVGIINGNLQLSWTNLTDGESIVGATATKLTVSNITQQMLDLNKYRCVATNSNGSVTSNSAGMIFGISNDTVITASEVSTFGELEEGYMQPEPQVVTIRKYGFITAVLVQPTSTNFELSAVSPTSLVGSNVTATFTVRPKAGLSVGTYVETIEILGYFTGEGDPSGPYDLHTTVEVSFTVTEAYVAPIITSVTVSPPTTSVQKGTTQNFNAIITGTGAYDDTVTWSVTGNISTDTKIDSSGIFTVDLQETATTLTVTATSNEDPSKTGTADITVTNVDVVKYTLTVNSGSGSGEYAENSEVIITSNTPDPDKDFDKWISSDGGIFADVSDSTTTFTMPGNAVTVTATYRTATYSIDVQSDANGTANAVLTEAAAGTEITLTATPNNGYQFKEWQVISGGVVVTDNKFTMPAATVTVKAIFELIPVGAPEYKITKGSNGSWKKGTTSDVEITCDGDFAKFIGIKVDGVLVSASNYTAVSGSTIVTLKAEYLETLAVGDHIVEIVYSDGSVQTKLTVLAKVTTTPTEPEKPGDNNLMSLLFGYLFVSGGAIFGITLHNKRKRTVRYRSK